MFTNFFEMKLPNADWALVIKSSKIPFVKKSTMYLVPFMGTRGYPVTLEQMQHITDNNMDSLAAMAYLRSV